MTNTVFILVLILKRKTKRVSRKNSTKDRATSRRNTKFEGRERRVKILVFYYNTDFRQNTATIICTSRKPTFSQNSK